MTALSLDDFGSIPELEREILRKTWINQQQLLMLLPEIVRRSKATAKAVPDGDMMALIDFDESPQVRSAIRLPDVGEPTDDQIAAMIDAQRKVLGFSFYALPVERWVPLIEAMATHDVAGVPAIPKTPVVVGGTIDGLKFKALKKSRSEFNQMARFTIEDETGSVPAMMWPDVYQSNHLAVREGATVFLCGVVGDRSESREIVASAAIPGQSAAPRLARSLGIAIGDDPDGWPDYSTLIDFCRSHPGPGRMLPVLFNHRDHPDPFARPAWDGEDLRVKLSAAMIDDAESRFGPANVYLVGSRAAVSREYLMTIEG